MEELLKGLLKELEGKNLTKKSLFELLCEINIDNISPKTVQAQDDKKEEEVKENEPETVIPEPEAICDSCHKIFMKEWYYKKHLQNNPVCVAWQSHPNRDDNLHLETGLHLILNNLLQEASTQNKNLVCRWCESSFASVGNLHKHLITSNVCNRMTFYEFKKLFNAIE